jgi:RNA polymerase sigma-70 factor (ECF subfamily)
MMLPNERFRHEDELRSAVLAGDEAAWRDLYDGAYAELWAYVVWRCARLRDLAEEVTQETWLVAVRRIREFDPQRGAFLAWLRGIAAKVLQNHLRARRKVQALDGNDVAEPAHETDQAELITLALADLPSHYEAVLRAKYLDASSVEQIAAEWGETPKTIESLLTRARRAFRDVYERLAGTDVVTHETEP